MSVVSPFPVLAALMLAALGLSPLGLTAASAQTPRPQAPAEAGDLDAIKTRDQELEALRAAQRRTLENEARLKREIESIGDDRRRFNQQLIDTASRVLAVEERIAQTQARLEPLDEREQALRTSLEQRRGVIAEILAALQRIGRRPPSGLMMRADDALQSVRSAMMLGAVLPEMRQQAEVLAADLAELVHLRQQTAAERDRLARDLFVLADERQHLSVFIEERQKRLGEAEQALERGAPARGAVGPPGRKSHAIDRQARTGSRHRRPRGARGRARERRGQGAGRAARPRRVEGSRASRPGDCLCLRQRHATAAGQRRAKSRNLAPRTASGARKRAYRYPPGLAAKSRPRAMDGWFMRVLSAIMANS